MNPLTNTRNITKLSQRELNHSSSGGKSSWHDQYRGSAWIFVGGLPYDLSEGDIIAIFSQYGEVVNLNLIRDKVTGKQKGFAFLCYEDQRSTVLAVDNFNGIKILNRTIRVDHVKDYKPPKDSDKLDEETRKLMNEGCAPKVEATHDVKSEKDLLLKFNGSQLKSIKSEPSDDRKRRKKDSKSVKRKKSKKTKHRKHKTSEQKKKKKRRRSSTDNSSSQSSSD